MNTLERIELNPKVMLGKPIIRGTRIPVELVLKKLSQNISVKDILSDYPNLTEDDVKAAIAFASEEISTEEIYVLAGNQ